MHKDTETLITLCGMGSCPTVYKADGDDVYVQGYVVENNAPDGENVVRIPAELIRQTAALLTTNGSV